jgi:hypothetical protein
MLLDIDLQRQHLHMGNPLIGQWQGVRESALHVPLAAF